MRLMGLDLETTGLEKTTDEITEIAWAIFDTDHWEKPLSFESKLIKTAKQIPKEITELTGITNALLNESGSDMVGVLGKLFTEYKQYKVDALVAHNAQFDRQFLEEKIRAQGYDIPDWHWICSKGDVQYPSRIKNKSLITLAAEHGFLNPFPHAAIFDVFTMMKIVSRYDIEQTFSTSKEPWMIVKALVDYNNREMAKSLGFSWEQWDGKTYEKSWIKGVRPSQLEELKKSAKFTIQTMGVL